MLDVNIGKLLLINLFNGRNVVIVYESKTKWIYVVRTVSNYRTTFLKKNAVT